MRLCFIFLHIKSTTTGEESAGISKESDENAEERKRQEADANILFAGTSFSFFFFFKKKFKAAAVAMKQSYKSQEVASTK